MTIGRRRVFGWGAIGLGAAALEGCGGAVVPGAATMGPADVESLLTELDQVVHQLEALDAEPKVFGIRGQGAEVARGRERCIGLLKTLCFMGTYRDVPEGVWREPRVAAHLAKSLPRIQSVITDAREHLAGMSDEEVTAIDERLLRDPELPMRIMERVDDFAKELHVPMEQRTYLRLSTAQLAARFRYEGTKAVTRKVASTFGRLVDSKLAELGVQAESWTDGGGEPPPHAAAGASRRGDNLLGAPAVSARGTAGESCVTDADCEAGLHCATGECAAPQKRRSKQLSETTLDVAEIGPYLLIPPLCGIGALVMLVCLFMVIVAGLVYVGGD